MALHFVRCHRYCAGNTDPIRRARRPGAARGHAGLHLPRAGVIRRHHPAGGPPPPGAEVWLANFEPLRQVLNGVRAILYFNAAGNAGLDRGLLLTGIGLIFWVVLGIAVTRWYDRRGMSRIEPEVLDYVTRSAREYGGNESRPGAERLGCEVSPRRGSRASQRAREPRPSPAAPIGVVAGIPRPSVLVAVTAARPSRISRPAAAMQLRRVLGTWRRCARSPRALLRTPSRRTLPGTPATSTPSGTCCPSVSTVPAATIE